MFMCDLLVAIYDHRVNANVLANDHRARMETSWVFLFLTMVASTMVTTQGCAYIIVHASKDIGSKPSQPGLVGCAPIFQSHGRNFHGPGTSDDDGDGGNDEEDGIPKVTPLIASLIVLMSVSPCQPP